MISWPPKEHTNDKAHKRLIVDAVHWVLQWFNGLQDSTNNQALVSDGNGSLAFKEVVTTEGGQTINGSLTATGVIAANGGDSDDWNNAYSWGDHYAFDYYSVANPGDLDTFESSLAYNYNSSVGYINDPSWLTYGVIATRKDDVIGNLGYQLAFDANHLSTDSGLMGYRTLNTLGWGSWRQLIHDAGGQTIAGTTLSADLVINESADHSETPTAGKGQLWVKNDTPCSLYFTDDAGTDYNLSGSALTYVEGTWTPTLVGSGSNPTQSYNAQVGTYTRIGRVVYFNCRVQMAISGISAGSGTAKIGGLPITPAGTDLIPATVGTSDNWGTTKGAPTHAMIQPSTSEVALFTYDNDAGNIAGYPVSDAADIGNQTSVYVSGHYEV